jgi:hypothetical protein
MPASDRRTRLTAASCSSPPLVSISAIGNLSHQQLPAFIDDIYADPDPAHVSMQMSLVLLALGQDELALEMQAQALRRRRVYRMAGCTSPSIRLLAVMGPGTMCDNTPLDYIVDNVSVQLELLFVTPDRDWPDEVPAHDVLFVAIGESERSAPLLALLEQRLAHWPRPVLNRPERIGRCARDIAYALLRDVPGLLIPPTRKVSRCEPYGLSFPMTMRPIDTHCGKGLEKIETPAALDIYLAQHSESVFYQSDFVDYSSRDGLFRKYRIALIDGRPHACHVAISEHWMVHYRTAGMEQSVKKRLEEASLMEEFERDFGLRHASALRSISDILELEYVVLDCAESSDGRLLLFEADIRGWIHASDPIDLYPYKPMVMQKAFDAFETMLQDLLPDVHPHRPTSAQGTLLRASQG